jgi:hypothetical protein
MSKIEINHNLCLARKNQKKDFHIQCPLHRKNNTDFCGKHRNYLVNKLIPINKKPTTRSRNNTIVSECEDVPTQINEVKSPKLSKKKHFYMIKPYEYHKLCKSTLTLIDYLYDKDLKYTDNYIKKTFKFYQLNKFSNTKLRHRFKTDNEKKEYMKEIKIRLQNFFETLLKANIYIEKIVFLQGKIRNYIEEKKTRLNGPALRNRQLCNNPTDFYSFDPLEEIDAKYFFSFKDSDGFIYGFHIESFITLISNETEPSNPYNRIKIDKIYRDNAIKLWQELNNKKEESHYTNNNNNTKDLKKNVRNKCLTLLQKIDIFGYQTKMDWIMELPLSGTRKLFKSIKNYWDFKAGLTEEVKARIYPDGNPFHSVNTRRISNINKYIVLEVVLELMNLIVSNGVTDDDKNQGCILLLFAINEVNRECGRCNPWLV